MLVMGKPAVDGPDLQGAYFDGSLELLRELAVMNYARRRTATALRDREQDAAPRCLARGVLRRARSVGHSGVDCQPARHADVRRRGGDHRRSAHEDRRTVRLSGHATARLVSAGYRSVLGVSTGAPEPLVRVAFWSKQPLAFTRAHVALARRIAYHLGLGTQGPPRSEERSLRIDDDPRVERGDARVQRAVEQGDRRH